MTNARIEGERDDWRDLFAEEEDSVPLSESEDDLLFRQAQAVVDGPLAQTTPIEEAGTLFPQVGLTRTKFVGRLIWTCEASTPDEYIARRQAFVEAIRSLAVSGDLEVHFDGEEAT